MAWTATDGGRQLTLWESHGQLLEMRLRGKPRGQGSLHMITRKGAGKKAFGKYSDPVIEHRNAMITALTTAWDDAPRSVALVQLTFVFERPAAQLLPANSKRIHPELRDTAPIHHVGKPDLDKLVRLVFDALTIADVLTDDCVVIDLAAAKRWADLDETAHTAIRVFDAT